MTGFWADFILALYCTGAGAFAGVIAVLETRMHPDHCVAETGAWALLTGLNWPVTLVLALVGYALGQWNIRVFDEKQHAPEEAK